MKRNHINDKPLKETPAKPRKPGRPPLRSPDGNTEPFISKEKIIARAAELSSERPLDELSISSLARDFGVATSLIHYYAGSRDDIVSGVINLYFRARIQKLPNASGNWRNDLAAYARAVYFLSCDYGAVMRYLMSHNRFRVFQQVDVTETDYGLVYLERLAEIFRAAGFSSRQSAMGYHLLMQHVMTSAYAVVNRQPPGLHKQFILDRVKMLASDQYPSIHFFAGDFSDLDGDMAFDAGLEILLDGFEKWRQEA
ncbi:TetR/AcrR family transcriptional regulator [Pusillimonas noertemannii]|uniref:TetR/AcrR family transcriptional regulator n=1 Tax=Pusillimonas noertemannii TaxID=305977 RepID=UPI00035DF777|nr:TetR/AcrR family transcriptional regulator C-terminal domain-containing protein [Pusillimonas noertemannii]